MCPPTALMILRYLGKRLRQPPKIRVLIFKILVLRSEVSFSDRVGENRNKKSGRGYISVTSEQPRM
jgi:hypothetical protein